MSVCKLGQRTARRPVLVLVWSYCAEMRCSPLAGSYARGGS